MVEGELNANCDQSVLKNVNINSGCSCRIYSSDRYVQQIFLFSRLRFGPREKKPSRKIWQKLGRHDSAKVIRKVPAARPFKYTGFAPHIFVIVFKTSTCAWVAAMKR